MALDNAILNINTASSETTKPWRLSPSNSGEINIQTKDKYLDRNIEVSIPQAVFSGGNAELTLEDPEAANNPNLLGAMSPRLHSWSVYDEDGNSASDKKSLFSSEPTITENSTSYTFSRQAPVQESTTTYTGIGSKTTATNLSITDGDTENKFSFTTSGTADWIVSLYDANFSRPVATSSTTTVGGGTSCQIGEATTTVASGGATTLTFSGLSGQPKWFILEYLATTYTAITYTSGWTQAYRPIVYSVIYDSTDNTTGACTGVHATRQMGGGVQYSQSGYTAALTVNSVTITPANGAYFHEGSFKLTYGYESSGTNSKKMTWGFASNVTPGAASSITFTTTKAATKWIIIPAATVAAASNQKYLGTAGSENVWTVTYSSYSSIPTRVAPITPTINATSLVFNGDTNATFKANTAYRLFYVYEDPGTTTTTETIPAHQVLWTVNKNPSDTGTNTHPVGISGRTRIDTSKNQVYASAYADAAYGTNFATAATKTFWYTAGQIKRSFGTKGMEPRFSNTSNYKVWYGVGTGNLQVQTGSGTSNVQSLTFNIPESSKGYSGTYFLVRNTSSSEASIAYNTVTFMSSELGNKMYYMSTSGTHTASTSCSISKTDTSITFTISASGVYFLGGGSKYQLYYVPTTKTTATKTYRQGMWFYLTNNPIPCEPNTQYIVTINSSAALGALQIGASSGSTGSLLNQSLVSGIKEFSFNSGSNSSIQLYLGYSSSNTTNTITINKTPFTMYKDISGDTSRQLTATNGLTKSSSKPASGYYIPINTGVPLTVTSPGWISGSGNSVNGGGYIGVPEASLSVEGGSNVTLSTTDNGIAITPKATGEGWVKANATNSSNFISGITVPSGKTFNKVKIEAGTSSQNTVVYNQLMGGNSLVYIESPLTYDISSDVHIRGGLRGVYMGSTSSSTTYEVVSIGNAYGADIQLSNLYAGSTVNEDRTNRVKIANMKIRGRGTNTSYPDEITTLYNGESGYTNAKIGTFHNFGTITSIYNYGTITNAFNHGTMTVNQFGTYNDGAAKLVVNASDKDSTNSSTGTPKTIVENGKWVGTNLTSDSNSGTYYGQINFTKTSSTTQDGSWPTSSSTSASYSSTNFDLSAGTTRYINIPAGNYTSGKSYGFTAPAAGTQEAHTSYTPSSTYFQTGTSGAFSTTAVIQANKYASNNYYIKAAVKDDLTLEQTPSIYTDSISSVVTYNILDLPSLTTWTKNSTPAVTVSKVTSGTYAGCIQISKASGGDIATDTVYSTTYGICSPAISKSSGARVRLTGSIYSPGDLDIDFNASSFTSHTETKGTASNNYITYNHLLGGQHFSSGGWQYFAVEGLVPNSNSIYVSITINSSNSTNNAATAYVKNLSLVEIVPDSGNNSLEITSSSSIPSSSSNSITLKNISSASQRISTAGWISSGTETKDDTKYIHISNIKSYKSPKIGQFKIESTGMTSFVISDGNASGITGIVIRYIPSSGNSTDFKTYPNLWYYDNTGSVIENWCQYAKSTGVSGSVNNKITVSVNTITVNSPTTSEESSLKGYLGQGTYKYTIFY